MARIKIDISGKKLCTIAHAVRITDINYGGHAGNNAVVEWLHEARMQWLQMHQYSELNFAGTSLIMSDLSVVFKNEAFYGDVLNIEVWAAEVTRVGFELRYSITAKRKQVDVLIARATTSMICFNYQAKKVTTLPDLAVQLLSL